MALKVPRAPGLQQMMAEGSSHYSGVEEAVIRSIEACTEFAKSLKTCYGPKGLNKMVINHLEKLFVTNDAATIIRQLDVQHPAAKIMAMSSEMQEKEVGDGTNFVILLSGALLEQAEHLIRMGLKPVEIIEGYELAKDKIIDELLPKLMKKKVTDLKNKDEVMPAIRSALMSKQYGNEDFLSELIVKACMAVAPKNQSIFNVDNVRICKILGSSLYKSQVVQGLVFKKNAEGDVTKVLGGKVVVYTCPIDISATETKGTVLIRTAEELKTFSHGEENMLEAKFKEIAEAGVKVIVSGGKFGDLSLHYCNKYNIMAVRLMSKFDVRRTAKTVNAVALPKLVAPKPEELGFCDEVFIDEIGDTSVVIFKQHNEDTQMSTILLRGATDNLLDDIERAVDDGVNTFKALTKDGNLLAGAGATEIELSRHLTSYAETLPGLEQYAVGKYAEALQSIVATIAENVGMKSNDVITELIAAHQEGKENEGINIENEPSSTLDAVEAGLFDLYFSKYWGVKYATSAACTILQVDLIVCAKPAGGPKPRQPGGDWDQD